MITFRERVKSFIKTFTAAGLAIFLVMFGIWLGSSYGSGEKVYHIKNIDNIDFDCLCTVHTIGDSITFRQLDGEMRGYLITE